MIVEHPRSLFWRKVAAHAFLIGFICLILGPFLVVVSISFREGNFTIGSLWPEHPTLEHWYLAFGVPFTRPDGTVVLAEQRRAQREVVVDRTPRGEEEVRPEPRVRREQVGGVPRHVGPP